MNNLAVIKKFNEYESTGEFLRAKELLIDNFGEQPDDQKMCIRLGICELRLKNFRSAEELFLLSRQLGEITFDTYFWIAALCNEKGEYSEAIDSLVKTKNHVTSDIEQQLLTHEYIKASKGLGSNLGIHLWIETENKYDELLRKIDTFHHSYEATTEAILHKIDDNFLFNNRKSIIAKSFEINTENPIAYDSDDYIHPRGTAKDNTRSPRFVSRAEQIFNQEKINHMDLGCAGGGLVYDFLIKGHRSIGLEGSDYSQNALRASWRIIPEYLKTCDITKPFKVHDDNSSQVEFDLITAWEVLEHIKKDDLPQLLKNITNHLGNDGMFVASVAQFEDYDPLTGAQWHVTLESYEWWKRLFKDHGLVFISSPFLTGDYVRGSGNPYHDGDWNVIENPELGFHIVAKKSSL